MSVEFDPYETLGVARDASAQQIEEAYQRLLSRFHPDRFPHGGDERLQDHANREFLRIQAARDTLIGALVREEPDQDALLEASPQQTPYNSATSRRDRRVFWVLGSAALLAGVVAVGGLFAWAPWNRESDDWAGWQAVSSEMGYEIRVPVEWEFTPAGKDEKDPLDLFNDASGKVSLYVSYIEDTEPPYPTSEWYDMVLDLIREDGHADVAFQDVIVAGGLGRLFIYADPELEAFRREVEVKADGKFWSVSFWLPEKTADDYTTLSERIVSSFDTVPGE